MTTDERHDAISKAFGKCLIPIIDSLYYAMIDYHREYGKYPSITSGGFNPSVKITGRLLASGVKKSWKSWKSMDNYLSLNYGITLSQVKAVFNFSHRRKNTTKLTVEQVVSAVKQYHFDTGNWPPSTSEYSKLLEKCPELNITWRALYSALHQGHRGLPGKMTISDIKLLAGLDNPGLAARKRRRKCEVTPENVKKAIEHHFQENDEYPLSGNRGSVPFSSYFGINWTNVERALLAAYKMTIGDIKVSMGVSNGKHLRKDKSIIRKDAQPKPSRIEGITPETVSKEILRVYEETGELVKCHSGYSKTFKKTWMAINRSLVNHHNITLSRLKTQMNVRAR